MKFQPYPEQRAAIDHIVNFLRSAERGQKQLYAAPTGCGKSVVKLFAQRELLELGFNPWIVTPREEIAFGMMDKLGVQEQSEYAMHQCRISTPIRLRNRLLAGELEAPTHLLIDEAHHGTAESWQQVGLLTGLCPSVGVTATPYRGSPRGTQEFLEMWGDPLWIVSYAEAEQLGRIAMPRFEVLPLVDDDIVEVRGGEFDVESLEGASLDRMGDMAEHARAWCPAGTWDRPTVFAMPSSGCCARLTAELAQRGMPSVTVSADTPRAVRQLAFKALVERVVCLLHMNIVTEGIDLPVRRIVDMAPTLSPVKWVQQLGRATRPSSDRPEYVGTNRNLLRHAYVLEGVVPVSAVAKFEKEFKPTERAHGRVLGLEAIGRFKPTSVKLTSGITLALYSLSVPIDRVVVEYCALVHPIQEPVWAQKVVTADDKGVRTYGRWVRCEPPNDLRGFASVSPAALSEKQTAWWNRSAAAMGIDAQQEVDRKRFQLLPVLIDTGVRFR